MWPAVPSVSGFTTLTLEVPAAEPGSRALHGTGRGGGRRRVATCSPSSAPACSCLRARVLRNGRSGRRRSSSAGARGEAEDAVVVVLRVAAAVAVAREHVEVAVGALGDVAQAAVLALEQLVVARQALPVEGEPAQLLADEVGEHEVALPRRAAARDERRARRRDHVLIGQQRALAAGVGPAVVGALAQDVDLVVRVRPQLGDQQPVGPRLPVDALDVAVTGREDLRAHAVGAVAGGDAGPCR